MPVKKEREQSSGLAGGLKSCVLCASPYTLLARACPRCGHDNEQFFNMPESTREAYVEFWHDSDVYRTMLEQSNREGVPVSELYKKAAEFYLDSLAKRKRG